MDRRIAIALVVAVLVLGCRSGPAKGQATGGDYALTPVSGPSWLQHLGIRVSQTRMGHMGGTQPAPSSARQEPKVTEPQMLNEAFVVAGADLYRMNCQSCHGPGGEGAPPEIKSLIEPVQGMSVALIKKRMDARGTPIDDALAKQLAAEAEATLRKRLQNGGEKMPAFPHLQGEELDALIGYLQQLAAVPSPKNASLLVRGPAARVGEYVVKGTCHLCHDATGPGGGHMMMMRGIIPSLASLPEDHYLSSVERQVHYGSSPMMQMMGRMGGDVMPAYPYFTEEEIAAAYFYLVEYPPQP